MTRVRLSRDPGGDWSGRVRAARSAGAEAIVYLNRYEGITSEGITRLAAAGRLGDLDKMTDRAFRQLVPEARDSWILLEPDRARVLRVLTGPHPAEPDPRHRAGTDDIQDCENPSPD